jgi:mannose-1-phosphate guanylyltransferase
MKSRGGVEVVMILHAAAGQAREDSWAIVLAGGRGSRLRGCTVDHSGRHVPKQYCVIDGERTLLQLAIARACNLVGVERVVVVVLNQHRRWWQPQLKEILPPDNVIVQPLGRGTGVGVLLPLLHVLAREPEAHVIFLPADHYFRHEGRLAEELQRTLEHTYDAPEDLVFVGIEPESPTSDFGYLVPRTAGDTDPKPIASFVEKPPPEFAQILIRRGALWNSLIFAACGRSVLRLIRGCFPHTVDALREAMERAGDPTSRTRALAAIYPNLASIDFSRDVLERGGCTMRMMPAAAVGWCELGTPERLAAFWDEQHPAVIRGSAGTPVSAPSDRLASLREFDATVTDEVHLSPPE